MTSARRGPGDRRRYDREPGFRYYAVFKDASEVLDLDRAFLLVRRPRPHLEEEYVGYHRWELSDKLYRLTSGRDSGEEYIAVSAAEAERLEQRKDRFWAEGWRHYVLTENGRLSAVVRTTTKPNWAGEEAFAGDRWRPSDLLSQASAPSRQVTEVDFAGCVEHMVVLVQRRRAEHTGGYAVFHRPADVLDLESAYEVVRQLRPEHRFSVPLHPAEVEPLAQNLRDRNPE